MSSVSLWQKKLARNGQRIRFADWIMSPAWPDGPLRLERLIEFLDSGDSAYFTLTGRQPGTEVQDDLRSWLESMQ